MLLKHIFYLASSRIDSDQLIVDVMIHDTLIEFELVQRIICCLNVTKLGTGS